MTSSRVATDKWSATLLPTHGVVPESRLYVMKDSGLSHTKLKITLTGNETVCKAEFAKMVKAVHKRHSQFVHRKAIRMEIQLENTMVLVHMIRREGTPVETRRFTGNVQYLPPEVPLCGTFCESLGDIWVLGISLYRMLVGRFPFHADSAATLFRKMQQGDFGIPAYLSQEAKDLLRRMLSPLPTRASLDLVMFHPWLKSQLSTITTPSCQSVGCDSPDHMYSDPTATTSSEQPRVTRKNLFQRFTGRKSALQRSIRLAITFIIRGPYPPPKKPYTELILQRQ